MIKLTEQDWEILNSFKSHFIDREEIYKKLHFRVNYDEFLDILLKQKNENNALNKFSNLLSKLPHSMNDWEFAKLCRILLYQDWHHEHESIIGSFQTQWFPKSKENVDVLLYIMNNIPKIYTYDELAKYSFIRKCLYAIAAQPEPYNIEALKQISAYEDERTRNMALFQLERLDAIKK